MKLTVKLKSAYGRERYFPVDEVADKLLRLIVGTRMRKSFDKDELEVLKSCGAEVIYAS